jgi:hypothetical protein
LAVSVARVIWRDSLAKIADTKIIGIDTQWDIWYNLSSVPKATCTLCWIRRCLYDWSRFARTRCEAGLFRCIEIS